MSRPSSSEIDAFRIDEEPMNTAPASPSSTSQKYSNELKLQRDLGQASAP